MFVNCLLKISLTSTINAAKARSRCTGPEACSPQNSIPQIIRSNPEIM